VIVTDLVFCFGCYRACKALETLNGPQTGDGQKIKVLFVLNYVNVGLFLIDNVHFQYNSMMYGLLVLSIAYIFEVSLYF
jgi:alpha-1,3-glucosyltransferase